MLPVNCGSHADYQNFVITNLRKYYPNPDDKETYFTKGNVRGFNQLHLNAMYDLTD